MTNSPSNQSGRRALSILIALLLVGLLTSAAAPASAKATNCGQIESASGKRISVTIRKGAITCRVARRTSAVFITQRNCGSAQIPACVVGKYHCRHALSGETHRLGGLHGYCYQRKNYKRPANDFSAYKPRQFRKVFILKLITRTAYRATKSRSRWMYCGVAFGGGYHSFSVKNIRCRRGRAVIKAIKPKRTRCLFHGCQAAGFRCSKGTGIARGEDAGYIHCKRGSGWVKLNYGG